MKAHYDSSAQAGYIFFSDNKVFKSVPVNENIVCDLDQAGMIVGIEIIHADKNQLEIMSKSIQTKSFAAS
ncbi:DUF2283 domain-containing protein [Candidatus Peregrinibacteria bacterium]|jgi:uncharacterized protein YuzE|nr:DUF2283 domain-containing protein [Candidatus Peregrinibacteria bacterium]